MDYDDFCQYDNALKSDSALIVSTQQGTGNICPKDGHYQCRYNSKHVYNFKAKMTFPDCKQCSAEPGEYGDDGHKKGDTVWIWERDLTTAERADALVRQKKESYAPEEKIARPNPVAGK